MPASLSRSPRVRHSPVSLHAPERAGAMHPLWSQAVEAHRRGDWAAAESAFTRIGRDAPRDALVALNHAHVLHRQGRATEALSEVRRCLRLAPREPLASLLAGDVMARALGDRPAGAYLDALDDTAWIDVPVLSAFASALKKQLRVREAVEVAMRALARQPDHSGLHRLLMYCMRDLGLRREAVECARTVLALDPDDLEVMLHMVFDQREACDWTDAQATLDRIGELVPRLEPDRKCLFPTFALLSLDVDPRLTRRLAEQAARYFTPGVDALAPVDPAHRRPGPMRVGFVSYDFREHPVAQLLIETFEQLPRDRCEAFLYSTSPDDGSALRRRLVAAVPHFVDVADMTTTQAAHRIRDDGIDVLVDLAGYTRGSRLELFALRPASVQASYLGYPGTTGAGFIDYLVGDAMVTPLGHAGHYTERIAQLEGCLLPGTRYRPLPRPMSRAEAGLPEGAFVMAALHPPYKILPSVFDLWCEVLRARPDAVLWLKVANEAMIGSLATEARRRGVDPTRLVWARKCSYLDYISQFALADVFVDTWPYNAHTTAADALWAGLPVLALRGETFAARVSASLLQTAGLADWVCTSLDDYRARLLGLAADPSPLRTARTALEVLRGEGPLFDSRAHAVALVSLFERMHQRHQDGLPPDHLLAATPR
jgi:predicted O-linked N-acetylglucosamine transferase (SPINDLY family)